MEFHRYPPAAVLQRFVECYWVIESEDPEPQVQKIIPDGYPEIIFHFGESYQINMGKAWEPQACSLVAGQIRKHFFLQNTGRSAMLGVKFKPAGMAQLFGLHMKPLTDTVVPLQQYALPAMQQWEKELRQHSERTEQIKCTEKILQALLPSALQDERTEEALQLIVIAQGCINMQQICNRLFITERQLQRLFEKYIGLSPKFYCRIIRFSQIFQLLQHPKKSWLEIAHLAGYFDQSHFIRDFKNFTGEDPSAYFFEAPNMANFFLNKGAAR